MIKSAKHIIRILGIETSCDETAAAVVAGDGKNPPYILSNIVASQVKMHAKTGGIVPEVAARAHAEKIIPIIEKALSHSNCHSGLYFVRRSGESRNPDIKDWIPCQARNDRWWDNIDAIAVTVGHGLIGSLLIGIETAKTLSYIFNKPIIPINHIEGHIYSNFVRVKSKIQNPKSKILFPVLCLIVSGGHTSLTLMKDHGKYQEIGSTRDDAAGEAFDKVAKMLGLPYPGGPSISKAAASINSKFEARNSKQSASRRTNSKFENLKLPRPMIDSNDFDFSFSGLKTAVLYLLKDLEKLKIVNCKLKIAAIAAEFQQAVVDVLVAKTLKAAKKYNVKTVILGGGVSANSLLRQALALALKIESANSAEKIDFLAPPKNLSTDNAAMIAAAGYYHYIRKDYANWRKIRVEANLGL